MFHIFMFLYSVFLFFVLTPGILITIPPKSSKNVVALVHTLVFTIVWYFTHKIVWHSNEGFYEPTQMPPDAFPQMSTQAYQQMSTQAYQQMPPQEYQQMPPQEYQQMPPQEYQQIPPQEYQQIPPQEYQQIPPQEYQQMPPPEYPQETQMNSLMPTQAYQQMPPQEYQQMPTQAYYQMPPQAYPQETQMNALMQAYLNIPTMPLTNTEYNPLLEAQTRNALKTPPMKMYGKAKSITNT